MSKSKYLLIFIIVFYFLTRLFQLTALPIFNDESTYIRYGLHELNEADHKPYSLLIGKEPLMPFLYSVTGSLSGDLLAGSRLVSVLSGFTTLLGIYVTTRKIAHETSALLACGFYVIAPYTLFFDRLALIDSPVNAVTVWTLYCTVMFLEKQTYRYAVLLGLIIALGLWMKTSAALYAVLPAIVIGFEAYRYHSVKHHSGKQKGLIPGISIVAGIIALLLIPLVSHEFYQVHRQLLTQYTYPLYSIFQFPFSVWLHNAASVASWLFFYLTPPVFVLSLVSIPYLIRKDKKFIIVFAWLLLPLLYEILYAKLYTSRHALSLTIPFIIFAGCALESFLKQKKAAGYFIIGVILLWSIIYDSVLVFRPDIYPSFFIGAAKTDLVPYVKGFSSGYGVADAVRYLQNLSEKDKIIIAIRNDHGNPEDAIVAYLGYNPNISVVLINDSSQVTDHLAEITVPVYFVSRGGYNMGLEKYFKSYRKFLKPEDAEYVGVGKLK